jgi:DNA polymerase I-like protein with 3'-5' exonuclease and polymerase domains
MELTLSNWPCASFLVRYRGLMHVLSITLHDEILIDARDGIEDQVQTIVGESMETAFKRIIPEVPFVAEIRVADSWKS